MRAAWSDTGLSTPRCLARWCRRTVALMLLLCELRAHGEEMHESVVWQRVFECREMCTCKGIPLESTTDVTPHTESIQDAEEHTGSSTILLYRQALENPE
eukprot:7320193-Pyramimonas_sp.AAC.1